MSRKNDNLIGYLPHQPPAGKSIYRIILQKDNDVVELPAGGEVIIRFNGDVQIFILIPHIIFIFGAMLLSTGTALEYFNNRKNFKTISIPTIIFIIIGGFILGPFAQYYAFGEFWTGFPFWYDLIYIKMLIAFIVFLLS